MRLLIISDQRKKTLLQMGQRQRLVLITHQDQNKLSLSSNFSLAKQKAQEACILGVIAIRDVPVRVENLFGERSDGFNVSEDLFFSIFPLPEIRIIPSGVVSWIPGTQDCGVLVRIGYIHVRPTRLGGRAPRTLRKRKEGGGKSVMSETEERNGSEKQRSRHCFFETNKWGWESLASTVNSPGPLIQKSKQTGQRQINSGFVAHSEYASAYTKAKPTPNLCWTHLALGWESWLVRLLKPKRESYEAGPLGNNFHAKVSWGC